MKEDDDNIVNPKDSLSNHEGSFNECLKEIQDIERENSKDKEKKPIPQSLIFTTFGIISCFLSYIETSLLSTLFYSYKNKDFEKSKLFLEDIKYISLFIVSLIIIRFKIKKPNIFQIILPILYCFISYSSTYLYSRNANSFILLSKVYCIIIVSIFFGINYVIKVRKDHEFKLPSKVWIGLLLAVFGILIEFISSYFHTNISGEDNIRFIYHYNDFRNYSISLTNGICYAIIIFLFDINCNTIEIIFDTLFYIGLFGSIICFILSLCYSEINKIGETFHGFGNLHTNYYILSVVLYLLNIFLQSILIKKCSIYSVGIIISSQISIRIIVDMIKYQHGSNSNIFTIISLILCFVGLFIICLYYISNHYNEQKLENTESFTSNKEEKRLSLMNSSIQNDD